MKGGSAQVLVLESDADVGRELVYILSREGVLAETTNSLASAIAMIAKRSFDVLVLDLSMFLGNETVVLSQIRSKEKHLRIVALGDLGLQEPAVIPIRKFASTYLVKPVGKEALLGAIRAITCGKGLSKHQSANLMVTLGARIRAERKRRVLTLKMLAEKTELSVSLISQIERAESAASVASLQKIAAAMDIPLQVLFEGF